MFKLPIRKCFFVLKICVLLLLVLSILTLFEHWRGGKRAALAEVADPAEEEYERQILEDEARIIPNLGANGAAAYLTGEDKRLGDESEKKYAINTYLSDRIPYNRTLADYRNPACLRLKYDAELPSASVVIIFHNEPYSVVVRTIWSVINSARRDQPWYRDANFVERDTGRTMTLGYPGQDPDSEFVYLKEIILVDDNSTLPELQGKLSHYLRTRLPPGIVRLVRLPDRIGLTRARLAGARIAVGDTLVFLDAHCEGQPDWLRPLLQRIKDQPKAVVVPIIDVVESKNFYYSVQDAKTFQGLMRARSRGARTARGDVLVFLDAHCETSADWLRPLLQRIRHKRDAVVTPVIDVVDQATFRLEAAEYYQVGGFTFAGHFTWVDVPEREKKRRGSNIAPTWSPTMAGGLFAMSRDYYWELGAYDEQMAGWGGENLEMSFRIWQCGGTLETIPCSRVGHVFRAFHPYGLPADTDTHGINTARMAEVWMDEYAELFYLHRPDLRKNPIIGDVTHRKILREKLHCKSFQWYLDNIYKEKFVPVRDVSAYGRVMNPSQGLCLDTMQREEEAAPLGFYPCHPVLSATQYLSLSLTGQLRDEEKCAELQYIRRTRSDSAEEESRRVLMVSCSDHHKGQQWRYNPSTGQLQHMQSGLCIDATGGFSSSDARARTCAVVPAQRWHFDYTDDEPQQHSNIFSEEQEQRLQKLKGSRRISRSLLSNEVEPPPGPSEPPLPTGAAEGLGPPEPPGDAPLERRHRANNKHKHKKTKVKRKGRKRGHKNKFILRVERTLMDNTEEHLELDVHCAHRRLLPNDSFVRDIVTILNEHNIRVINNGRVFERNRVTELGKLDPRTMRHEDKRILHKMEVPPPAPPPTSPAPPPASPAPLAPRGTPATQTPHLTTQVPAERLQKRFSKKHRARLHSVQFEPVPPAPAPAPGARAGKIIVEDFVAVGPQNNAEPKTFPITQHQKKRKRKYRISPAPPRAADEDLPAMISKRRGEVANTVDQNQVSEDSDDRYWATDVGSTKSHNGSYRVSHARDDSAEDAPRTGRTEGRQAYAPVVQHRSNVERFRHHSVEPEQAYEREGEGSNETEDKSVAKSKRGKLVPLREGRGEGRTRERDAGKEDENDNIDKTSTGAPVKLVMKSNLTFNLGDALFAWRRRPDFTSTVGKQLSLPSPPARPAQPSPADASSASESSAE